MSIKLKICGMRDPANMREVAELKPDYLGFIFYEKSPRCVPLNFEMPLLPEALEKVGVFVNEEVEKIMDRVKYYRLDFVQLHGDEPAAVCDKLREKGIRVIKVFSIDEYFDFKTAKLYSKVVDYFLFDTRGKFRGGNAKVFNWNLLHRYDQEIPFFLSGGLSTENIQNARTLHSMNLHAFDANSGVESAPGIKDVVKVAELIRDLKTQNLK